MLPQAVAAQHAASRKGRQPKRRLLASPELHSLPRRYLVWRSVCSNSLNVKHLLLRCLARSLTSQSSFGRKPPRFGFRTRWLVSKKPIYYAETRLETESKTSSRIIAGMGSTGNTPAANRLLRKRGSPNTIAGPHWWPCYSVWAAYNRPQQLCRSCTSTQ